MLDLERLVFSVDTSQLDEAVKKLEGVASALQKIEAPSKKVKVVSEAAAEAQEKLANANAKVVDSQTKVSESTDKVSKSSKSFENILQRQVDILGFLVNKQKLVDDGFTKSQSNILATAKSAGASTAELKELASVLKTIGSVMGESPFDKSASGLATLRQKTLELSNVSAILEQKLGLTRDQIVLLARDQQRAIESAKSLGKSNSDIIKIVDSLTDSYLKEATALNTLESQALAVEEATRRQIQLDKIRSQSTEKMNASLMEQVAINNLLKSGRATSLGEARSIAGFEAAGVDSAQIDKYIMQMREAVNVTNQLTGSKQNTTKASREMAAADKYLVTLEQRLDVALDGVNEGMSIMAKDRLAKLERSLKASSLSTEEQTAALERLRRKIAQVDESSRMEGLQRTARGISTQLGDIGISLASGQNPFIVFIQQGDQIRSMLEQMGLSAKETSKVMGTALQSMAESFSKVFLAIGGFGKSVLNSIAAPIERSILQTSDSVKGLLLSVLPLDSALVKAGQSSKNLETFLSAVRTGATLAAASLVAGSVALVAMTVEAFKLSNAILELNKNVQLTGAGLGLTSAQLKELAQDSAGGAVSTIALLRAFSEVSKESFATSENLVMISRSAIEMERAVGASADKTIAKFKEMQKDPVEALIKLQKETGNVSSSTIQYVGELVKQGETAKAVEIAMKALADSNKEVTSSVIAAMGPLDKLLYDIKVRLSEFRTGLDLLTPETVNALRTAFTVIASALERSVLSLTKYVNAGSTFINVEGGIAEKLSATAKVLRDYGAAQDKMREGWDNFSKGVSNVKIESTLPVDPKELAVYNKALNESLALTRNTDSAMLAASTAVKQFRSEQANLVKAIEESSKSVRSEQQKSIDNLVELGRQYAKAPENYKVTALQNYTTAVDNHNKKFKEAAKVNNDYQKSLDFLRGLLSESEGFTSGYTEELKKLEIAAKSGKFTQVEINKAYEEFFKKQPFYKEQIKKEEEERKNLLKTSEEEAKLRARIAKLISDSVKGYDRFGGKLDEINDIVLSSNLSLEEQASLINAVVRNQINFNQEKNIEKLRESALGIQLENQELDAQAGLIGLTDTERKRLTETIKAEAIATKELADQRRQLAEGRIGQAEFDANAAEIEKQLQQRIANINKRIELDFKQQVIGTFSDAIATALFDGGKSGTKKIKDYLKNEFKNYVIRVLIQPVINELLGSTGISSSGIGNLTSSISSLSEAFSKGGEFISNLSGSINTGVSNAFTTFARSSLGQKFGLSAVNSETGQIYTTQTGSMLGQAASAVGGAFSANSFKNMFSGGFSFGSGTEKQVVTFANAIAGALFPAFAPIIGALTGVANRLFGRKLADTGIKGTIGGSEGFTGQSYAFYEGGFFRSDKTKTENLDQGVSDMLAQQFRSMQVGLGVMATSLGIGTASIENFTKSIEFSFKDLTEEQIQQKLAESFSQAQEELAQTLLSVEKSWQSFAKPGETAVQVLSRLSESLTVVNSAFTNLEFKLLDVSVIGAELADKFLQNFSSVSEFVQASSFYYENFYESTDRTKKALSLLTQEFSRLTGKSLPETRAGFKAVVDAAASAGDTTLVANLLKLAPAFAELVPVLEETVTAVEEVVKTLAKDVIDSFRNVGEKLVPADIFKQFRLNVLTDTLNAAFSKVGITITQQMIKSANATSIFTNAQDLYNQGQFELAKLLLDSVPEIETLADNFQSFAQTTEVVNGNIKYLINSFEDIISSASTAASKVSSIVMRINDLRIQEQIKQAEAINARADRFAEIAKSLKDFISASSSSPQNTFKDLFEKSILGDTEAMQALPSAAQSAIEAQKSIASTSGEFEREKARILNDIMKVQKEAEERARIRAEVPQPEDPIAVALRELASAVSELGESVSIKLISQFDKIDTSLNNLVSEAEFKKAFKGTGSDSVLSEIFNQLDTNNDGQLTKLEAIANGVTALKPAIEEVAKGSVTDKAEFYNALRETGLQDADIRALVEGAIGPQTDENWMLLKDIAEGLKLRREAELDVQAVINLIDGQSAFPASLKDALISGVQTVDMTINSKLDSNMDLNLKRVLIEQGGVYNAGITAAIKEGLPEDVLRVISSQGGKYSAVIDLSTAASIDPNLSRVAITGAGTYLSTVNAVISATMPSAEKRILITQAGSYLSTIDAVLKSDMSAEAKKLALDSGNVITATIGAVAASDLPADLRKLATASTNELSTTVKGVVDSTLPENIKKLLLESTLSASKSVALSATLGSAITADQRRILDEAGGEISRTVKAVITGGSITSDQQRILSEAGGEVTKTVTAIASGVSGVNAITADQRKILDTVTGSATRTVTLDVIDTGLSTTEKSLLNAVTAATDGKLTVSGTVTFDPGNALQSIFNNISKTNDILVRGLNFEVQQYLGVTEAVAEGLISGQLKSFVRDSRPVNPGEPSAIGDYTMMYGTWERLGTIANYLNSILNLFNGTTAGGAAVKIVSGGTSTTPASTTSSSVTISGTPSVSVSNTSLAVTNSEFAKLADIETALYGTGTAADSVQGLLYRWFTSDLIPQVKFSRGGAIGDNVYAKGGVFTNTVVTRPTEFNQGLMGEAGKESIMPLRQMPNGDLGVAAMVPSAKGSSDEEEKALLKDLIAELQGMRYEVRNNVLATNKINRVLDRVVQEDAIKTTPLV